jgi:hypothetical protein
MAGLPMVRPDQRHNADRDSEVFSVAMLFRSGPLLQTPAMTNDSVASRDDQGFVATSKDRPILISLGRTFRFQGKECDSYDPNAPHGEKGYLARTYEIIICAILQQTGICRHRPTLRLRWRAASYPPPPQLWVAYWAASLPESWIALLPPPLSP